MAEYYPLLVKAVSALDPDATEARHALYDRARKALIGQLRTAIPALPDTQIDSEGRALDLAIARIEAEIAVKAAIRGRSQATSQFIPPVLPPAGPEQSAAVPQTAPPQAASQTLPPQELRLKMPPPPPPRPAYVPPLAPRAPIAPPPARPNGPAGPTIKPIGGAFPQSPQASANFDADGAALDTPRAFPANGKPPRAEPVRAPTAAAPEPPRRNLRGLIVTLAILAVVGIVAAAAYWLRQTQDELAQIARPAAPVETPADAPAPQGKIVDRIGVKPSGPAASTTPTPAPTPAQAPAPSATPAVTPALPASSAANAPASPSPADTSIATVKVPTTTLRPAPPPVAPAAPPAEADGAVAGAQVATGAQVAAAPAPAAASATIPVAHRAAILVDAPDDPSKLKTFPGTVIWRVEQVKREGKPTATVLRAEIEIPSAKSQIVMTLQKNLDASLPASHMMEVRFTIAPGSDLPGIKAIRVPEMRKEETPNGDPLNGAPVPVVDNFFIVGLAKGEAESQRNIDLISSRNWIDVPLQLSNKKDAKLTFEKGATGERALAEALAAWK